MTRARTVVLVVGLGLLAGCTAPAPPPLRAPARYLPAAELDCPPEVDRSARSRVRLIDPDWPPVDVTDRAAFASVVDEDGVLRIRPVYRCQPTWGYGAQAHCAQAHCVQSSCPPVDCAPAGYVRSSDRNGYRGRGPRGAQGRRYGHPRW